MMQQDSIDYTTIEMLKDILEDDFIELIETFLADASLRISEMQGILEGHNGIDQLEMPAHTLKGSSGNIGAVKLSQYCAQLVENVRDGKTESLTTLVDDIAGEYNAIIPQLNNIV